MPLMSRLKGTFFHELSPIAQLEQIRSLQLLRTNEIKLAKVVKSKPRKATTRKAIKAKKGSITSTIGPSSAEAKALKLLENLSPDQLKNLQSLLEE